MVRHNNQIPHQHFHKNWQPRVKTNFNQPGKKVRRNITRIKKVKKVAPKPVQYLRPVVSCPTFRYNSRIRIGRGFTKLELQKVGINPKYAKTIGIAVEYRRKNRSIENFQRNVQRLKTYLAKLVVWPKSHKKVVEIKSFEAIRKVNNIRQPEAHLKVRVPSKAERQFEAYITLRKARSEGKSKSRKLKRKKTTDPMELDSEIRK